ncbi:hypothetical protein BGW38_004853, partial [Lunasporangiospora selenospora]
MSPSSLISYLYSIAITSPTLSFDQTTSKAFSVEIESTKTVDGLKKLNKAEKSNAFSDVDADQLSLWRVSIPDEDEETSILVDNVLNDKIKLSSPRTRLSKLFPESPDDDTYIIVQRPPPQVHAPVPARSPSPPSAEQETEA